MPDVDLSQQIASEAARQAAQDPRVQEAVKEQAMAQGQAYAAQAQASWCESFRIYLERLQVMPKLCPLGEVFALSQPDAEAWHHHFGRWNVLYCQAHMLVFPIYMLLMIVFTFITFSWWALITQTFGRIVFFMAIVILSHTTYYWFYEKGGCCGGAGAAIWMFVYVFAGFNVFVPLGALAKTSYALPLQLPYLITLPPTVYVVLCLWKVGGGEATKAGLASAWNAGKNAVSGTGGARETGAGGATLASPAVAPAAH